MALEALENEVTESQEILAADFDHKRMLEEKTNGSQKVKSKSQGLGYLGSLKTDEIENNFSVRRAQSKTFLNEETSGPAKVPAQQSSQPDNIIQQKIEMSGLSRAENFLNTFIKSNYIKPAKHAEAKSQKQTSKATSNASVINLKANKATDSQNIFKPNNTRRVLSNLISTKLVTKPTITKQSNSKFFDGYRAPYLKASASVLNEQHSYTQGFLMDYTNMDDFEQYVCPDSPNQTSTQSGSGWLAAKAQQKRLEMPSPAKSTQSVTKDNHISATKLCFTRLDRTPEKLIPSGLFKNSTNLVKEKSKQKVISKSKHSLGKESCLKLSSTKLSGLKLNKMACAAAGPQHRLALWDTDIVAFGTPMKEDALYTEPNGRFLF